jgi:RNA 2',3'-cyclic 3'-phosphodiesterase
VDISAAVIAARDRATRPEARALRLFVAVDLPDEVKSGLAALLDPLRPRVPAARWTRTEGWHVTLKFLGATWPRLVDDVRASVARAAGETAPFASSLTHLGVFPSPGRARVVWVGLEDTDQRFVRLAGRLDELLSEHFVAERRPFSPHLTLARLNPPRDLRTLAPDLVGTSMASDRFSVDRLVLYRSHLSPKGARYEPLLEAPLSG